jgi:hypothetical protein
MQLPKTLNELRALVQDYVTLYGDEDILVEGMRPDEYACNVIRAYESEREVQKVQKVSPPPPSYTASPLPSTEW